MQISYQDTRFSFMGFWQENQEGELTSYKRVAMLTLSFRGRELFLDARLDGTAKWYVDDAPAEPLAQEGGFRFSVPEGSHRLKAVLVSPNRIYLHGAQTDGEFLESESRPYVHFIGDSITHAYPGFASTAGDALNVDYSVVAHCGMSLVDGWGWYPLNHGLKARLGMESNYFQLETPDVTASFTPHSFAYGKKPNAIVIYLGVNDYLTEGPTFKEDHPEIFAEAYLRFVQQLRKLYPEVPVVLLQCHLPDRKIRIDAIAKAYVRIRRACDGVFLTDTHLWEVAVCADKVHPSEAGYARMAEKVTDILKNILGR